MPRFLLCLLPLLASLPALARTTPPAASAGPDRPRLVVGIVVDQMRYDYLTRFWERLGEQGFKRLLREGTQFHAMHYNYVPTATGPGHAAIWSGAYPANSGIANNDFFDRDLGEMVYCVDDFSVETVGSTSDQGQRSPRQLRVTTVGDELKLTSNQRAQVVSISLKDRGSILPAGHLANGAFWFDYATGRFITSSFYAESLPEWVEPYNARGRPDELQGQPWILRDAPESYTASRADGNAFEGGFAGESAPVFPHELPAIAAAYLAKGKDPYYVLGSVPGGNTLVRELSEAALQETDLGRDAQPDVLAVSFSATDYIGHNFGPASLEVEDTYRRLDEDIAALLQTIDDSVGLDQTLVFLTADHAAAYNAPYLQSLGFSGAQTLDRRAMMGALNEALSAEYGEGQWVQAFFKGQFVLDRDRIRAAGLSLEAVQEFARDRLREEPAVVEAFTVTELRRMGGADGFRRLLQNGCHPTRSGDVFTVLTSGSMFGYLTGTAHSESYTYDTQVPFLIRGPGVAAGADRYERVVITQIAPTLSALLRITAPSAAFEGPLPLWE